MLVIRRLFGTGTNCIAPSGLPLLLCLFPGLAPWAVLLDPFGVLGFAPETRLEVDLEPELHPPGLVELGLDAPEIGIIDIAAAGIESRPIEQVEQLPAEVDPARFGEAERLRQGVVLP